MRTHLSSAIPFVVLAALGAGCSPSSENAPSGGGGGGISIPSSGGATGQGGATAPGAGSTGTGTGGGTFIPDPGTGSTGGEPSFDQGGLQGLLNSACASNQARTEQAPSVLQFVVDTSGSMGNRAPGTRSTKWDVTKQALKDAITALPESTGVGILYFPETNGGQSGKNPDGTWQTRPVNQCLDLKNQVLIDVAGPAGSPHRTAILTSLDAPGRPNGGTPTHDAYNAGIAAIQQTTLPGKRYVVLITDGQPTYAEGCAGTGRQQDANDPRPIIATGTDAASKGVDTFVIGSPGSDEANAAGFPDARTWLSMLARAGGTAAANCADTGPTYCHFDMTQQADFSTALQQALQLIVGTVVGCSYAIPANGNVDAAKVNVVYTPAGGAAVLVPKFAGTGACTDGWQYSADGKSVELCQNTCNVVRADKNPELDVIFGCATQTSTPR